MVEFSRSRREALAAAMAMAASAAARGSEPMQEPAARRGQPYTAFEVGAQEGLASLREASREIPELAPGGDRFTLSIDFAFEDWGLIEMPDYYTGGARAQRGPWERRLGPVIGLR